MRSLVLVVVIALVGAAVYLGSNSIPRSSEVPAKSVEAGDVAPDFKLEGLAGRQISLSSLRGKVVLVNFWATWCPPCREEMPSMERLHEVLAGDDFVMLAINTEKNGRTVVPEFLKKNSYTFPILLDDKGEVQGLYGVYKFPETFIVRKDGVVENKVIGSIDWSSTKTISYLKGLIGH
jgi:peroxiredoxin